jgi:hypothetical protein
MKLVFCICTSALIGSFFSQPCATTLTVSKSGADAGAYMSIQGAIDAAKAKDTILILDSGIYEECVSIVFKKDLTIRSTPSLSIKPKIIFQDKQNVGPKTCEEGKDSATITYQKNGALRILESSNITIEGLIVDGKEAFTFGSDGIWKGTVDCQWAMQSGNTSIAVYRSSNVIIKKCEITNGYFGIYFTGFLNTLPDGRSTQPINSIDNALGSTGNHLVTDCKIHHNSFGLFFENDHDMGIVVHHNLFFDNHHKSTAFANQVKALTSEGNNQPSGAMLFTNLQKTPVSIYNNTFYHNFLIFIGAWRPGNHYLIFNNIYAEPFTYWSNEAVYQNSFMAIDPLFVNRMYNSVYACQTQKPQKQMFTVQEIGQNADTVTDTVIGYQPRIMNAMGDVEAITLTVPLKMSNGTIIRRQVSSVKVEGNHILGYSTGKPFPLSANIRWLETKFKSADPSTTEFLIPDWGDSLAHSFILDSGWAASGIRDADGSNVDLGAISACNVAVEQIRILAAATLSSSVPEMIPFYLISDRQLTDYRIEYCRFIHYNPIDSNAYGGSGKALPLENIHEVTTTGSINNGFNLIQCKIGSLTAFTDGHFEIIVSGVNSNGIRVSSTPGFIPVRVSIEAPALDISFNTIDTADKQKETIEFVLKAKHSKEKLIYRQLSLQKADGSDVLHIHGKTIYLDSLVVSAESVPTSGLVTYVDTFTVVNTTSCSALPFLFKTKKDGANNLFTYSTHFVKLTTATSINNHIQKIKFNTSTHHPQSAAIYNLMGKKILTIPYSRFSIPHVQSTLSKGIYIVKFTQANGKEIKEAGITKFIVH